MADNDNMFDFEDDVDYAEEPVYETNTPSQKKICVI